MQKIISIAAIAAVAFSAAFVFFVKTPHSDSVTVPTQLEGRLKTAIPYEIDGWTSKDSGLGDTEEVQRAAEKVLNVTDYVNRTYSKNGADFTVYIAYWKPDTMEIHRASSHSPDRCWVRNGWKNDDSKKKQHEVLNVAGKNLMPAYYREYTVENMEKIYRRYVWFWFVVDGKRYDYKTSDNYAPNPIMYVKNMVEDALQGSPEMYFVRIDSDIPLAELFKAREFKSALEKLGELILFEKKQPESGIKK